jgi:hypothetical protein
VRAGIGVFVTPPVVAADKTGLKIGNIDGIVDGIPVLTAVFADVPEDDLQKGTDGTAGEAMIVFVGILILYVVV